MILAARSSSIFPEPIPGDGSAERIEQLAAEVVEELRFREMLGGEAYPFANDGSSIECRRQSRTLSRSSYAFCLSLSVLPWGEPEIADVFPERIFEELSTEALQRYTGGEALRFGAPRVGSNIPVGFAEALEYICEATGEGQSVKRDRVTGDEKDGGVDVIAWKAIDGRVGKLMVFGACATGENWEDKLDTLAPGEFCRTYFYEHPEPTPQRAFFTCRLVPRRKWLQHTRSGGILFDRLRVSQLTPRIPQAGEHGDGEAWMREVLRQGNAVGAN